MTPSKAKSPAALTRAVAKYEAKLARAANPTQRQYATTMLRMARAALAESLADQPTTVTDPEGVVTLGADEYEVH